MQQGDTDMQLVLLSVQSTRHLILEILLVQMILIHQTQLVFYLHQLRIGYIYLLMSVRIPVQLSTFYDICFSQYKSKLHLHSELIHLRSSLHLLNDVYTEQHIDLYHCWPYNIHLVRRQYVIHNLCCS